MISFIVKDHKTGVDVNRLAIFVNRYCIGMTANIVVLFVNGQIGMLMQKMTAAHTRNSCPDNRRFMHVIALHYLKMFLQRTLTIVRRGRLNYSRSRVWPRAASDNNV